MRCLLTFHLASFLFVYSAAAQLPQDQVPSSVLHQIAAQFQQGNVSEAERAVRAALEKAPHDPAALSLLGVILDSQQRYGEAETAYQKALAVAPGSPAILNNLGNHYLAQGKTEQARAAFLKVVGAKPRHPNANLQLAQLSVAARQGAAALKYLDRLPPDTLASPPAAILRAQALKLSGQDTAALNLLGKVESLAGNDPSVAFSVGLTFAGWQHYSEAENAFTRALDADPTNFDVLYNLGLAAQHAGHTARALDVYRVALRQRPDDADCLFNLASIYVQTGHPDEAIVPLIQAHSAAPDRPDILFALAQTSQDIGFYGDAITAIDQYLKLKPHDDIARRERGFCLVRWAKPDQGMEDLRWYVERHPRDPRGLYELAIGETVREPDKTLVYLNQALTLDPKFNAARYARAVLYYEKDRTDESIADLKIVLAADPNDAHALDALGQDYMHLNRYPEAADVLQQALKLAPKDPRILTHYARALVRLGRKEEAEKVMDDFRSLGPEEGRRRPHGGLFEYLSLPPEQQFQRYMENLQKTITTRPDDPTLRIQLGKTYLQQGQPEQAIEAFRVAEKLTSKPELLLVCGKALFDFGQYAAAREFLEPAAAAHPEAADLRLDLAAAVFKSAGPEAGLKTLDETPPAQRQGDYFLLRAEMLDAMNKPEEAAEALNQGLNASPTRADLFFEGAMFLIKHKQYQRALHFLERATQLHPDSPQLLLAEAIAYGLVQQYEDGTHLLLQIESRWPEWSLPYEIHGMSLETRVRSDQAQPLLETAISLGARDANVYYYLASAISHNHPDELIAAQAAIQKAVELNPNDAFIQSLAGKICYERKEYPAALDHLNAALRLWPDMIEAHQALAGVYKALGEKDKSIAELKDVLRIKQENPTADQTPPLPAADLLFTVQPSARPPG